LRLRHVADVSFWTRIRTEKRSDKGIDAGHVDDIASGASYTPLKITCPRRSSRARKATWETPQSRLEITADTCALCELRGLTVCKETHVPWPAEPRAGRVDPRVREMEAMFAIIRRPYGCLRGPAFSGQVICG